MTKIDTDFWQIETQSVGEKSDLLDYAAACGVLVPDVKFGYHTDTDAYLSWFGGTTGIGSLPCRHTVRITRLISAHEFRQMCDAYQQEHAHHKLAA